MKETKMVNVLKVNYVDEHDEDKVKIYEDVDFEVTEMNKQFYLIIRNNKGAWLGCFAMENIEYFTNDMKLV